MLPFAVFRGGAKDEMRLAGPQLFSALDSGAAVSHLPVYQTHFRSAGTITVDEASNGRQMLSTNSRLWRMDPLVLNLQMYMMLSLCLY